ncbi:MAG: ABC transporter permease subunit [Actinomycetota bacterium]|nr:ABC transporter permease subunit [Actinomycetota bacterium]
MARTAGTLRRQWRRPDPARSVGIAVVAVAAVALVVVPLLRLLQVSAEEGTASLSRVLSEPGLATAAWHSLLLALVVPLLAVPLGAWMAVLIRGATRFRTGLRIAVVLPLVVPQFVLGYSWQQAYGRAGFTDSLVGWHWAGLNGPWGVILVLVVDAAPIAYLLTAVGLATRAQPEMERAARMSGASGWTTLRTVTVPLLGPSLVAATALIFVGALEAFAVPQVLGTPAGFNTVTTRVYANLSRGSDPAAFADAVTLALLLVLAALIVLIPADLVLGPRLRTVRGGQTAAAAGNLRPTATQRIGIAALAGYTVVGVALPTIAVAAASITKATGLPPTPGNWTLTNFSESLSGPVVQAIGNSVVLAAAAATGATGLGVLVAVCERRLSGRLLATAIIATFAVPGTTLAVGLSIAYGPALGGTVVLILLAYLAKFWAIAHRTSAAALDRFPDAERQAARISGAGPAVAAGTIWLPAMRPALIGGWLLVFIAGLHEVTMSSLLYSFGNETLAVAVLNRQELGDIGGTAALSVILTVMVAVAAVPVWLLLRPRDRTTRRLAASSGQLG